MHSDADRRRAAADLVEARFLDVPVALTSVLFTLLLVAHLNGTVTHPWRALPTVLLWIVWALMLLEVVVKCVLTDDRLGYLRDHRLEIAAAVVPPLGILRIGPSVRRTIAMLRRGPTDRRRAARNELLKRRRVIDLAFISVLIALIGAAFAFIFEAGAKGTPIQSFGDALYWSASLMTTVGSQLCVVTPAGRVVSFVLMLYSVALFTYFASALASVLVGSDAQESVTPPEPEPQRSPVPPSDEPSLDGSALVDDGGSTVHLTAAQVTALRAMLQQIEHGERPP